MDRYHSPGSYSHFFVPWIGTSQEKEDDLYRRLRDDPRGSDIKEHIENLWKEYRSIAPIRFLTEAQINFHQRWWEMYLAVGLLHLSNISLFNIEISKKDKGPDIKLILMNGARIWIEAVAPEPGDGPDRVPEHEENCVFDLPKNECLLRLAQGLKAKQEKFKEYRDKNIVDEEDLCIIAISSCSLHQFGHLLDFPCSAPLGVLSGADKIVLSKGKPPFVSKRQGIVKVSGHSVPASRFDDSSFDIISAILYSSEDPLNAPLDAESTFKIFLNPNAKNPLPKNFSNDIETWNCERSVNGEIWTII